MAANSQFCFTGKQTDIDFNGNTISTGQIWSVTDNKEIVCVEIIDNTDKPGKPYSATTQYSDCYECVTENNGLYIFLICGSGEQVSIPVSELGDDFFLSGQTILSSGSFYLEYEFQGDIYNSCVGFSKMVVLTPEDYEKLEDSGDISTLISISDLYIDEENGCKLCEESNPSLFYSVTRCTDKSEDYVLLPSSTLIGHLISYTDGVNEYCGEVMPFTAPTYSFTFLSDYGVINLGPIEFDKNFIPKISDGEKIKQFEGVDCDECLINENKKILIQNCVDSSVQEVVWASQLFQNGDVTNINYESSCYEIVGETDLEVTLTISGNYETYTDCENCLECYGIYYEYALCSDPDTVVGTIYSYQVIPVSGVFYTVENGWVIRKDAVLEPSTGYNYYYSVLLADDCENIPFTPIVVEVEECETGNTFYTIVDDTKENGDVIQLIWGQHNVFCTTIINTLPEFSLPLEFYNFYNSVNDGESTTTYNDCEDCMSNTNISVKTINCYNNNVENFDLSYLDWLGFWNGDYNYYTFSDSDNICRTMSEICPQPLTGNLLTGLTDYSSCFVCELINPEPRPITNNSINVVVQPCGTDELISLIVLDTQLFIGKFYQLSSGQCVELISIGEFSTQFQTDWFPYGPFDDCDECLAPLRSSDGGNGGVVCEVCSGSTFTVDPIKPTYTNEFGKSVEQINAVLIGGNGLNA
jgi:hypothetical protein